MQVVSTALNSWCRYATFLRVKGTHAGKLCTTYDIELAWHSHMTLPHEYRSDTESLLGAVLPHDDPINDHTSDAELGALRKATEALFARWGEQLFVCGGMFRGIPERLDPGVREAIMPGVRFFSLVLSLPSLIEIVKAIGHCSRGW
jgi:hypothetical protein